MAIRERYRVAGKARARYVRKASNQGWYEWCEQSADNLRFDVAQGTCDAEDLPAEIKKQADDYDGIFYACEWPL